MKTFLWTTLFRIVAIIAFLVISGFGDIVNPVFDQTYLTRVLPVSVRAKIGETAVNNFKTSPELCTEAENVCIFDTMGSTTDETSTTETIDTNEPTETTATTDVLTQLFQGQSLLSYQIEEQFKQLSNQINTMQVVCSTTETATSQPEIDPVEQRKQEIKTQIEALQTEMQNL
ncbi:MAG: hypothetical protein LBH96_04035 [Candidatus Peribacteria bacterium]|jgi:hypothetical protein|nr:hypothetical protein [Candidatus Peribacteria bacterium]